MVQIRCELNLSNFEQSPGFGRCNLSGDVKEQATTVDLFLWWRSCISIQESCSIHSLRHIYSSEGDAGMTLKNVALLALIGTILLTALLLWDFVFNLLNLLRGLIPATIVFSSFVYAFAGISVAVFFYVFHRAQS
jgi:hypothetical protein